MNEILIFGDMQFGRVDPLLLSRLDLGLPPDHAGTARVLAAGAHTGTTRVHVGCTGWGLPGWVGKIYPKGTKPGRYLEEYAKQFSCIELNATWYQLPSLEQVAGWCAKTGNGFRFCPKFTQGITHERFLKPSAAELEAFVEVCEAFGEKLGPLFLMPHPGMNPADTATILAFLSRLPRYFEVFTELRHPAWFASDAGGALFDEMEKRQYGMVITDAAGRRDCVHMRLTSPDAFIRFVGNGLHPTDYTRIDAWVERLGIWMQQGLHRCWFFIHQHEELHTPELCRYFMGQMNEKYGLGLTPPRFMDEQELRLF